MLTYSNRKLAEQEAFKDSLVLHFHDKGGKLIGGDRYIGYCTIPFKEYI